jgi:NDP-hexose-3-ketoreductase
MTGRLRVGVLGCSSIAWRRTLPALAASPYVDLVAVASRDEDKAKRFATAYGCAATDYTGLVGRGDVQAVYVSLPPALHAGWGRRLLSAGKHVLMEKPLATTAADGVALVELARRRRLLLRENFTFEHHGQHDTVRRMLDDGRLGDLRSFTGEFCFPPLPRQDIRYDPALGGGALLDCGVYPLRQALLLLGTDLALAGAALVVDPERGVDLAGQALLTTPSGVLASIAFGFTHTYGSRYSLWGGRARLTLDRAFTPPAGRQPVIRIEEQDHAEEHTLPAEDQMQQAVDDFARAVLDGATPGDPAEFVRTAVGLRTLALIDEIRRTASRVGPTPAGQNGARS